MTDKAKRHSHHSKRAQSSIFREMECQYRDLVVFFIGNTFAYKIFAKIYSFSITIA